MGSAASSIPAEELSKPLDASDVSTPRGETALAEVRRLRLLLLAEASSEGDEWKLVEELTCYCGAVKVTANGAPAIECFCHCVRLLHTTLAPLAACAAHDPHPDPRSPSLFASSHNPLHRRKFLVLHTARSRSHTRSAPSLAIFAPLTLVADAAPSFPQFTRSQTAAAGAAVPAKP